MYTLTPIPQVDGCSCQAQCNLLPKWGCHYSPWGQYHPPPHPQNLPFALLLRMYDGHGLLFCDSDSPTESLESWMYAHIRTSIHRSRVGALCSREVGVTVPAAATASLLFSHRAPWYGSHIPDNYFETATTPDASISITTTLTRDYQGRQEGSLSMRVTPDRECAQCHPLSVGARNSTRIMTSRPAAPSRIPPI